MAWPLGSGWPTTRTVASVGWPLMAAARTARCRATTVPWCGASAHTASTCTASSSGSTRSRCSSTAPCAARSGSSRSDAAPLGCDRAEARTGAAFVFHQVLTLLSNK
uniref:Uncharacterized protein n=1 Tax=Suricata suricatta TaxID=37032 RepID=A0A673VQR3_SURSU